MTEVMIDLVELYVIIDDFCFIFYTERFFNVIAEAMLHKLPCVVINAGNILF